MVGEIKAPTEDSEEIEDQFTEFGQNIEDRIKRQEQAFKYIYKNRYNDFFKDQKLHSAFSFLYLNHSSFPGRKFELSEIGLRYEFCSVLVKFLDSSIDVCRYYLNVDPRSDKNIMDTFLPVSCLISIIRNFANYSVKFCASFHEANGIQVLLKYLSCTELVSEYLKVYSVKIDAMSQVTHTIIRGSIGGLVNLSRLHGIYKDIWKENNAVEKLLSVVDTLKELQDCVMALYITLVSIADEEEIEKFPLLKNVIPDIIKIVNIGCESLKNKKDIRRAMVQLSEKDVSPKEVCLINYQDTTWHIVELLKALYKMAVNDSIKYDMYKNYDMSENLREIIQFGNETEIEHALKLLWQLCFDKRISDDVYNDKNLYEIIVKLSKSSQTETKLVKNANGILWLIKKFSQEHNSNDPAKPSEDSKHIMISYNKESRDLCMKIKTELENVGLNVWIDVEHIHGSSLESMASAIENSYCILMCMTEKYKQSTNCRAEAEYAFNLSKPIIPLIMQSKYRPDGWLGIILGSKIFIDFMKYEYDECIKRLFNEINQFKQLQTRFKKKESSGLKSMPPPVRPEFPPGSIPVLTPSLVELTPKNIEATWTEKDVKKWLIDRKINKEIFNNVYPCNGEVLAQLYKMQCEAPEFFYSSISSNKSVPTREVASFSCELRKLFQ